ncbi:hypothetical protein, partial [Pseudomonas lurida]|uniref:hypothetical protein n=1 Tax=Pseudomonas lurida TaxID=244566 RepID=UPI0034D9791F
YETVLQLFHAVPKTALVKKQTRNGQFHICEMQNKQPHCFLIPHYLLPFCLDYCKGKKAKQKVAFQIEAAAGVTLSS